MRYTLAAVAAALAGLASAQFPGFNPIYTPESGQEVTVGQPVPITWDVQPAQFASEELVISLIGGDQQNTQVPLYTVTGGTPNNGRFDWTPSTSEFGKNFYGLVMAVKSDPNVFQYSNPFKLVAPAGGVTTTTTTTDGSTTSPTDTVTTSPTDTVTTSPTDTVTTSPTDTVTITTSSLPTNKGGDETDVPTVTVSLSSVVTTSCTGEVPTTLITSICDETTLLTTITTPVGPNTFPPVLPTTTVPVPENPEHPQHPGNPQHPGYPHNPGFPHGNSTATIIHPTTNGGSPNTPTTPVEPPVVTGAAAAHGVSAFFLGAAALAAFAL